MPSARGKKNLAQATRGRSGRGRREGGLLAVPSEQGPDYIGRNKAAWERWAPEYEVAGRRAWREDELRWGIWGIPESELQLFEALEQADDVVELGCGTAVVSAWLAREGFRPVAVDFARAQLETVSRLQLDFGLNFPVICVNAEQLWYEDASFDVAVSEYGASLWCSPHRWLPEAHRLLRPGGTLIFFTNGAFLMACTPTDGGPAAESLVRDYFSMEKVEFPEDDVVEFHPTHGEWIRLLHSTGFVLENLIEVQPPPEAEARFEFVSLDWARQWPSEEIWIARKAREPMRPTTAGARPAQERA
jgi:SAM-dependent methyltransferase